MKILVVGPGAMGLLFSSRLKRAGYDVLILDYKEERARLLNEKGIRVEGISGEFTQNIPVTVKGPFRDIDLVIVCVKAYNTESVAESLRQWLTDNSTLITLQNGLGNMEALQGIFHPENVLGGITSEGATLIEAGRIRHAGTGETIIGPDPGGNSKAKMVAGVFKRAGFNVRTQEDVHGLIWGKLIINVGINAFSAILQVRNGALPSLAKEVMEEAVNEAVSVSRAKGINLPYENPFQKVLDVCDKTSQNIASMLQDVLNKRKTEVEYINGAIVKEGSKYGIPTPVNRIITSLILGIERSYEIRVNAMVSPQG